MIEEKEKREVPTIEPAPLEPIPKWVLLMELSDVLPPEAYEDEEIGQFLLSMYEQRLQKLKAKKDALK